MTDWRPIETAPHDVEVLLCWPFWQDTAVIGQFYSKSDADCKWMAECAIHEGPGPTHWMPLPRLPAGAHR